jgi:HEAT repeat protein
MRLFALPKMRPIFLLGMTVLRAFSADQTVDSSLMLLSSPNETERHAEIDRLKSAKEEEIVRVLGQMVNLLQGSNDLAASAAKEILPAWRKTSVPVLIRLVKDESPVQIVATDILAQINVEAAEALPMLFHNLKTRDRFLRIHTSMAIFTISGDGKKLESDDSAISTLAEALHDGEKVVGFYAASTLAKIGQKAIPQLIVALRNDDPRVRKSAVFSLSLMGKAAQTALTDLQKLLDDKDQTVKTAAEEAITSISVEIERPPKK